MRGTLVALSFVSAGACHYDLDRDLPGVTVPGSSAAIGPTALPPLFSLGVQSADDAGYDPDLVRSAKLRMLRLQIVPHEAPGAATFDFLRSVRVYVDVDPESGEPPNPRECARLDPVPRGATVIDLEPLDVELQSYLDTGAKISGVATGELPAHDVTFDGDLSVRLYF